MSTSQRPVTIAGWPWIGNVFTYRRRKSEFLSHLRDDGRALTAFKLGGHKIILLKRPEDILHVEQRNAKNYVKATMLRDLVGDGILMSEGEKWRRQRRLIQPHFHPGPVAALEALMLKRISTFLTDLEQRGSTPIDLGIALKRLVFGIVLEALFGETREEDFDELLEPMITVNEFLTSRFNELLPLPLGFPIPRYRKFQNAKSSIDRVIYRYIEIKKSDLADGRGGGDLLTKMMSQNGRSTDQG
ncbi:cytochrome P450 [bacterium]|nr:cytochrome P450 [bacterium]